MCRCAEGVSDNQKGIIRFFVLRHTIEKVVDLDLAEISVGFDQLNSQKLGQLCVGGAHNWGIVLEIDFFAGFDGIECFDGDVLWVAKS